jgi:beta-lactamase regulating signal transducer with metallopeptidase domain
VWGAGALFLLAGVAREAWRVARIARAGRVVVVGRVAASLARAVRASCAPAGVRVAVSARAGSAFVWGRRRPLIVLPAALVERLTDAELDAVLLHELAHLQRGDGLARWAASLACRLLWPHPLVWWLARQAERESEFACDEEASRRGRSPSDLARGLAKAVGLAVMGGPRAVPAMAAGDVARRLQRLSAGGPEREPAWRAGVLLAAIVAAVALLAVGANPCLR